MKGWRQVLGHSEDDLIKRLRRGDDDLFIEMLHRAFALYGWGLALHLGVDVGPVETLHEARSAVAVSILVMTADHLLWLASGGAESRNEEKFSNDRADWAYVIVALLGGYLLWSNDARLNHIHRLCGRALDTYASFEEYPTREAALALIDGADLSLLED